ncbi:hypothetical protein DYB37_008891 [Aphanomyces astaci]|uniref:HSF-type DNA-binding domain-containing protein n=1 Tax=Aphanomyces astaci TaxID=112090 RepID=A0A3R6Y7T5_APHAT|nr:hypothetical protein DYB35_006744 [Aphanomyces astaci]RHZ03727.1 hypothetical protein DYB37_008891 [Aphanomyces astaci]
MDCQPPPPSTKSLSSPFQLHIQLPDTYNTMQINNNNHPHHRLYYGTPVGTPTTPDSQEFYSGDESPVSAEFRKASEMAPFLRNLRNMLDRENPEVLRWNKDGTAFEIHDMDEMMNSVLPKYFKHKKYTSFQRQLNYFNFKKWTKSRANVCTFSNELFTRHEPYRSSLITRKKSVSSMTSKDATSTDTGDEYDDDGRYTGRPSCDSPCSSVYSCDSPVLRPSKNNTLPPKATLDLSLESMSLHKTRMSSYENKHLTRVLGGRKAMRKSSAAAPTPLDQATYHHSPHPQHQHQPHTHGGGVDDMNWFGDNEFNNFRDSTASSMTSTASGDWDDATEMNWVDLLPYNDPAFYDMQPQSSNSLSPLRGPFEASNTVTFFAAI